MKRIIILLLSCMFIFGDDYKLSISEQPTRGDVSISDKSITYTHNKTDDINTIVVDSIEIYATDDANNKSNNVSDYILIIPTNKLELYILNNPLEIVGHNIHNVSGLPSEYDDILSVYKNGDGMIFILSGDIDVRSGRLVIFDPVGNMINNQTFFDSRSKNDLTFIAVWDGRNNNGRIVGLGSYVVYIEVEYVERINSKKYKLPDGFEDVDIPDNLYSEDNTQTFNAVIGIKY